MRVEYNTTTSNEIQNNKIDFSMPSLGLGIIHGHTIFVVGILFYLIFDFRRMYDVPTYHKYPPIISEMSSGDKH